MFQLRKKNHSHLVETPQTQRAPSYPTADASFITQESVSGLVLPRARHQTQFSSNTELHGESCVLLQGRRAENPQQQKKKKKKKKNTTGCILWRIDSNCRAATLSSGTSTAWNDGTGTSPLPSARTGSQRSHSKTACRPEVAQICSVPFGPYSSFKGHSGFNLCLKHRVFARTASAPDCISTDRTQ
ncbi:unnamed protein product [Pleuronectes platessa]|uniref:Uncharacterized protein n=1 Tax=Pleuronectes platessa TaxID=8262 RepID=A0A9N7UJJ3_PLEPL|nr:unnamed protein product [Pleuronectes platessa]